MSAEHYMQRGLGVRDRGIVCVSPQLELLQLPTNVHMDGIHPVGHAVVTVSAANTPSARHL